MSSLPVGHSQLKWFWSNNVDLNALQMLICLDVSYPTSKTLNPRERKFSSCSMKQLIDFCTRWLSPYFSNNCFIKMTNYIVCKDLFKTFNFACLFLMIIQYKNTVVPLLSNLSTNEILRQWKPSSEKYRIHIRQKFQVTEAEEEAGSQELSSDSLIKPFICVKIINLKYCTLKNTSIKLLCACYFMLVYTPIY